MNLKFEDSKFYSIREIAEILNITRAAAYFRLKARKIQKITNHKYSGKDLKYAVQHQGLGRVLEELTSHGLLRNLQPPARFPEGQSRCRPRQHYRRGDHRETSSVKGPVRPYKGSKP